MNVDNETVPAEQDPMDKPLPLGFILLIPVWAVIIVSLLIFPIAGDWRWWEGWAFVLSFAVNMGIGYAVINQRNPRVIRNRAKTKKQGLTAMTRKSASSDWFIMPFLAIGFYGALLIPALGHRHGWPSVPVSLEIIGLILSNVGTAIMSIAMLQNSYASKILDINEGQRLIDTGLYAHVRHPLYASAIPMILPVPLALGSWWGLIPAVVAVLSLVVRIEFEEKMLVAGMDGYEDYQRRVKHKLIPGIY